MEVKKEGIKLTIPVGLCSRKGGGRSEAWWRIQMPAVSGFIGKPRVIHRHQVLLGLGDGDLCANWGYMFTGDWIKNKKAHRHTAGIFFGDRKPRTRTQPEFIYANIGIISSSGLAEVFVKRGFYGIFLFCSVSRKVFQTA